MLIDALKKFEHEFPDQVEQAILALNGDRVTNPVVRQVMSMCDLDATETNLRLEICKNCNMIGMEGGEQICKVRRGRCKGNQGSRTAQINVIASTSWLRCPKGFF